MCETTRAIERHPETQRRILDIRRICQRIVEAVRDHVDDDKGDADELAERHA